jgi:glutathione S-transferase
VDRFDEADMLRWMFWEQYSHEPNIATLRFWMGWIGEQNLTEVQRMQMAGKRQAGDAALGLMDEHLRGRAWFVGEAMSLADVCLFAYTHVAGEAEFDLGKYPGVAEWIERVRAQPAFVPMSA